MDGRTLTIPEAMTALGVSDKTIRRLLKRGDLDQAGTQAGRILITAESVARVGQQVGRIADEPDEPEPGYQMVPARQYEMLQATAGSLAQTVHNQAVHIEQLQATIERLQAEQRTGDTQALRQELDSLRTEMHEAIERLQGPEARLDTGLASQPEKKPGLVQRVRERFGI